MSSNASVCERLDEPATVIRRATALPARAAIAVILVTKALEVVLRSRNSLKLSMV